jgi:hypothetical protein
MLYNKDWDRKPNPVADVLMKAADLLEKHGHVKMTRKNPNGSMCFLGALKTAQGRDEHHHTYDTPLTLLASEKVMETLGLTFGRGYALNDARHVMADWNNEGKRTAQEVIDAMRQTAKSLEKVHA